MVLRDTEWQGIKIEKGLKEEKVAEIHIIDLVPCPEMKKEKRSQKLVNEALWVITTGSLFCMSSLSLFTPFTVEISPFFAVLEVKGREI